MPGAALLVRRLVATHSFFGETNGCHAQLFVEKVIFRSASLLRSSAFVLATCALAVLPLSACSGAACPYCAVLC
jgi:hypothetical protein